MIQYEKSWLKASIPHRNRPRNHDENNIPETTFEGHRSLVDRCNADSEFDSYNLGIPWVNRNTILPQESKSCIESPQEKKRKEETIEESKKQKQTPGKTITKENEENAREKDKTPDENDRGTKMNMERQKTEREEKKP